MLKALFRVRIEALKSWLTGSSRAKKAQSRGKLIAFAALMLYAMAAFGFLFWTIFDGIAGPFHAVGMDWLFFSLAASMSFAGMFIASVFAAKAQLYEARDNELLLSLPIKPRYILISRLFMLWVINLVMGIVTSIPAILAWTAYAPLSGLGLAAFLLLFVLLLPLFSVAVAALFGWLLSLATSRVTNKSLITVLLSLIFLGAYMYAAARLNSLIGALAQNPQGVAQALGAVALLYWIGAACAGGELAALLKAALVMLAACAIAYVVLERTFLKTSTSKRGGVRKKYVLREEKAASPRKALFRRELQRFLSCPGYILNSGLGAFMALAAAAALLIKGGDLVSLPMYSQFQQLFHLIFLAAMCFLASTLLLSASSVSLEGKNLWIAKSLPVETVDILRAKLQVQNAVALPPLLLCSCAALWVMRPGALMAVCFIVLPALFSLFVGLLGLMENLRHPYFDWTNETQAVKSGMSVLFTMLISFGSTLALALCYVFFGEAVGAEPICLVFMAVLALLCLLLGRWIKRRGVERYMAL